MLPRDLNKAKFYHSSVIGVSLKAELVGGHPFVRGHTVSKLGLEGWAGGLEAVLS